MIRLIFKTITNTNPET